MSFPPFQNQVCQKSVIANSVQRGQLRNGENVRCPNVLDYIKVADCADSSKYQLLKVPYKPTTILGMQSRTVKCQLEGNFTINDDECTIKDKPMHIRPCYKSNCVAVWKGTWSPVSIDICLLYHYLSNIMIKILTVLNM